MRFGIFDHMDRGTLAIGEQYRARLTLIEAYERAGFYAYHLAEHHGTPIGLAPSPSVFLAAVAQHTSRIRFGPLVYTLSIHHPQRLIEEICMLDHLSNGRLELGIGRGVSPIEMGFYGVGADARERFEETYAIVMQGLTEPTLNFSGKYYSFKNVPQEIRPLQTPHPPLWYGVAKPDSCAWVVSQGMNMVNSGTALEAGAITARFREEWSRSSHAAKPLPMMGLNRHVVVAATDAEAFQLARAPYQRWYNSLLHLWRVHEMKIPLSFPDDLPGAIEAGYCVVGSPNTVRENLTAQIKTAGINYLVSRLAFGELPLEASLQSVALLEREVMPALRDL